ncbi:MAG: GGDEF domain-containing protein [Clostridia bacterium]|nr:GGDEF domain-containing protein [Clostridia bacterium]MBR5976350.1 GGDEF domain-containing protein [Clostridia bacterium]MBR5991176.1 GGDEF domain-containing protein [Clostridia bacterium]MBR6478985.1 GGDEF domain-containing protein [Clostridia bacterium]MBR6512960.1 GGDEF domain-containing protein [Clostridia bacterium]
MERLKNIFVTLFGNQLGLHERFFNIACIGGAAGTIMATVASAISISRVAKAEGMGFWELGKPGMIACAATIIFFILTFVIYRISKNLNFSIVLCLVGLNFILFPALYLTVGGIGSGMPIYFVMGIVFTVLMLETKPMIIMCILETVWYVLLFLLSGKHPEAINDVFFLMPEWAMYLDEAMDFFTVALSTSVLVKILALCFEWQQNRTNELLKQLEELSVKDPLSGAYNRRFLLKYIESGIEKHKETSAPLSIIMFDIDKFKRVNDDFGHLIGDEVIKGFAQVLLQSCRNYDVVARYGGEEFILVMPGASEETAYARAEQIRQKVETSSFSPEINRPVTVSGGVAGYLSSYKNVEEFIAVADEKLYTAKETGRNKVIWKGSGEQEGSN